MNQRDTEDLADALSLLIRHIGDVANHDVPVDTAVHSARIVQVVERIEDAAFKRGVQGLVNQMGRWDERCDDCHECKPFCQCP